MSKAKSIDVGERRDQEGRGSSRKAVYVAVGTFYIAASLLNGRFLHEDASRRTYGPVRNVWVAATRPLSEISTFLKLDTLRASVEKIPLD